MPSALILSALLFGVEPSEKFVVLSEFQVWADASGPEVFRELSKRYLARGRSHIFELYPRYDYFVWDSERMRGWVDEAVELGAFNVFCIGDDTRTAKGHLFSPAGLNPELKEVFFDTIAYAHRRGLMVAIEPLGLPKVRKEEPFRRWLRSWLGGDVPAVARADIIKLSIEWFGAYGNNPEIADEVEAFFAACREINPEVLIYVDSIGGKWRQPQPFHRWLLGRFPGTIISHYLNTSQVGAFRAMGARNMMVQINPSETAERAGQFFIYHEKTVDFLQDAVRKRVRYLSLAGVNFGYSRYNYDLFLEVVRPHLRLARNLGELRRSVVRDAIPEPATKSDVRKWLLEERRKAAKSRREPPLPLNKAGRPAFFGAAPQGCVIRRLAAIGDGKIGPRFAGAHTDPYLRRAVGATFGLDFGDTRKISKVRVVPCLHPDEATYVATKLRIEYRADKSWRALPGGDIRDNQQRDIGLEFEPLAADAVRLIIEAETDDGRGNYRACCQELTAE